MFPFAESTENQKKKKKNQWYDHILNILWYFWARSKATIWLTYTWLSVTIHQSSPSHSPHKRKLVFSDPYVLKNTYKISKPKRSNKLNIRPEQPLSRFSMMQQCPTSPECPSPIVRFFHPLFSDLHCSHQAESLQHPASTVNK